VTASTGGEGDRAGTQRQKQPRPTTRRSSVSACSTQVWPTQSRSSGEPASGSGVWVCSCLDATITRQIYEMLMGTVGADGGFDGDPSFQ
jgi:hypothetical protein